MCEDPKITLTVLSDGEVRCEIEGMSAPQTEGTEIHAGFAPYSNMFGITRLETVGIDHYGEYETPIVDLAYFDCRCEYSPTQVIMTVAKDELFAGRYTDQQIVFVRK